MPRFMFVFLAGLTVAGNIAPASAQEIFCTVVGVKQGTFQGDRTASKATSQIPVLFLTEEVTRPFDTATGLSTGMRTHKPLTIVKELDASSPQFFAAAVTNETLRSVICTFYRANRGGTGEMHAYFRISLTNAAIVDYRDAGDGINGTATGEERERISMTYQRIELSDLDANTAAEDDWSAGAG
ncbi:MAG: type VI secretion system tube protein Hcp [Gammaproteobacteria bacterium]|nr:type VI secretion system tube protein Hcp [Gammaproteobacteria bacterium]MBV8307154.1 type VI secretion system tube protein Hcp [Gammaproteobacteria bacterium]MBV8405448.1 type VI secretion system tube protein Hcp [Gammaproteobacteria bacterium]